MTERKMDLNELFHQHQLALHRLQTARSADHLQAAAVAADSYAGLIARKRRAYGENHAVLSRSTYCTLVGLDRSGTVTDVTERGEPSAKAIPKAMTQPSSS